MASPDNVRQFTPVEIPDDKDPALARAANAAALSALTLGLKTLSQRAIAATRDVFTLLSAGSAFLLWYNIPDPKPTQIIALSLYAVFVLAANVIVRRV